MNLKETTLSRLNVNNFKKFNKITSKSLFLSYDWLSFLGEVYNKDPKKYPNAKLIKSISYNDVINKNLKVMDLTAISLAKDTNIPIFVTNILLKAKNLTLIKDPIYERRLFEINSLGKKNFF